MILTTLVENSTLSRAYKNKHGLCIHLKTETHNILFDLGPDDTFMRNAKQLNIDITDVDIAIISHGHKDHGGGLETFLRYNDKAKIYISKYAFDNYYASFLKFAKFYVGLNQDLKQNNRIVLIDKVHHIDEDMILISNIQGELLRPKGNNNLFIKNKNKFSLDNFKHEQHLILKGSSKNILISGCSHTGILNILEDIKERLNLKIDIVIGGLHLYNPINRKNEDTSFINELGNELLDKNMKFYTCHCTGEKAFSLLRNILDKDILSIKTGQVLKFEDEN